jgi:hypothetical protein
MQGLHDAALDEYYGTPIVDAIDPRLLLTMYVRPMMMPGMRSIASPMCM